MGVGHHHYRMSLQMECFGQSRDRFRLLNAAVGVEHKAVIKWMGNSRANVDITVPFSLNVETYI